MMVAFVVLFAVIALSMAYTGLVRGEFKISKTRSVTGRGAKIGGLACLALFLLGVAGAAWMFLAYR